MRFLPGSSTLLPRFKIRFGKAGQLESTITPDTCVEKSLSAGSFCRISSRAGRRVFGLCRYMLDSRESAEDATSEVPPSNAFTLCGADSVDAN